MLTMGFIFNGCEKDNPNATSESNSDSDTIVGCTDPEATNYDEDATEPCEDDECCEYGDSTVGCMDPEATNYDEDATEPCDECCEYDDNDQCDDNGMAIIMNEPQEMVMEICLITGSIEDYGCDEFCNKDIYLYGDNDFSLYLELFFDEDEGLEATYQFTPDDAPFFSPSSEFDYNDSSYYELDGGSVEVNYFGDNVYEIIFSLSSDDTTLSGTYYGELEEDRSLRSKKARM